MRICNNFLIACILLFFVSAYAQQNYYDWTVSFSHSPLLGVGRKVILINDQFPGPLLNITANDVVSINIHNNLTEPFLMTWNGLQMRRNSWQDGVQGTNCPIMPGQNWTYSFQMKDQIGSYFYFPSLLFQKAGGGYGPIRVNNHHSVPIPFPKPDYEYDVLIGDWYDADYQELRMILDGGGMLPLPDGVLINGIGPYEEASFDFMPGATYRLRISNVGLKTTLNFRIQGHLMLLVETEGAYTLKQYYESLDIHVGQSYSVLVRALNQTDPAAFYMMVASRFSPRQLIGVGLVRYSGFQGEPRDPVPPLLPPYDFKYSIDQALSIRLDLPVGAARPNPQGSYHYGNINITRTLVLDNHAALIDGKYRCTVNGISFVHPDTPLKLADYYNLSSVFESGIIPNAPSFTYPHLGISVIDAMFHEFVHVVFQNPMLSTQTWHSDGYNFFVVGMGIGDWNERNMDSYNMVNAIYRSTVQVYPLGWTAILIKLDNEGMWNLRSQDLEKWYLGQELYIRVKGLEKDSTKISPRDEAPIPDNVIKCGRAALIP